MSTIKSSTTTTTAYSVTADTTGALVFQTGATPTTAMTLGADQSVTFAGTPTYTGGTANGVAYLNGSKVLTTGSALVFDGTNLGIATSSPVSGYNLTAGAGGTTANGTMVLNGGSDSNYGSGIAFRRGGTSKGFIGTQSWVVSGTSDDITLYAGTSGALRFYSNGAQNAILDTSGNLGLGVTPSASSVKMIQGPESLVVSSQGDGLNVAMNAYFNSGWKFASASVAYASNYLQTSGQHRWNISTGTGTAGNAISFTQAMTLDTSGNLLVGTTTALNGSDRISVLGAGANVATFKNSTNSSGYSGINSLLQGSANNTSTYHFWANTAGVGNWYLYGNGTSSFSSDQRLKKNIETTRDGYIEDLCKLRVVKYNWKNDSDGTPKELGLIAQEVEQVFAGLVQDDLNPIEEGGEIYKQVKQSVLPFMLLKAIQEQQAIIQAQAADIAALKEKVGI